VTEKISAILERLDQGYSLALKNCRMVSLWEQIVDERVQKNTEPIKIRNRTLYVSASSSTWAQELTFLKKEIMKKFNEKAGEEIIRDIRFKSSWGGE